MKTTIYFLLFTIIGLISYSFIENQPETGTEIVGNPEFKNLKILPKDISEDDLKAVMHNFNDALGVKCSFCHAPGNDGKLDFASDGNDHKEMAREMMKMTMAFNKKYFDTKNPKEFQVTCFTCHNGSEHPAKSAESKDTH